MDGETARQLLQAERQAANAVAAAAQRRAARGAPRRSVLRGARAGLGVRRIGMTVPDVTPSPDEIEAVEAVAGAEAGDARRHAALDVLEDTCSKTPL